MKAQKTIPIYDTVEQATGGDQPTVKTYKFEFGRDGVVVGGQINTYLGQQGDLRYYPSLVEDGSAKNLITIADDGDDTPESYIAGNGENIPVRTRREFSEGDVLTLRVENHEPNWNYTASAFFAVDFEPDPFNAVRGWF